MSQWKLGVVVVVVVAVVVVVVVVVGVVVVAVAVAAAGASIASHQAVAVWLAVGLARGAFSGCYAC